MKRCDECGSWGEQCASDEPVAGCGCSRCACYQLSRLNARLDEAIDIVETIQAMPPERIGSREYGWLRDWLAAARFTKKG